MSSQTPSIWDKIDLSVLADGAAASQANVDLAASERAKRKRRRLRQILDLVAVIVWAYVLLKLFFIDIDRLLVLKFFPSLSFLLDYRFLVFLAILAITVFWGKKRSALWIAYVVLFPLIVLCWKLPRAVYRTKSWMAVLVVLNVGASIFENFRLSLFLYTFGLIAAVLVLFSTVTWILILSMFTVAVITLVFAYRTVRKSLQGSRFLRMQTKFISRIASDKSFDVFAVVDPGLKDEALEKWNKAQLDQFRGKLGVALCAIHGVSFWAHELREYQKSGAVSIFGILSYIWLYVRVVVGATLFNYALFSLNPTNFHFDESPGFLKIFHYSLSALAINGVDGLSPHSDAALAVSIFLGFLGPLLLATLGLHLVVNSRQAKREDDFRRVIVDISSIEESLARRINDEYQATPDEALRKFRDLGESMFIQWIDIMAARTTGMRRDFDDAPDR